MKKILILFFAFVVVAPFSSFAQDGKANIAFKKTAFDFGTIKEEGGIVNTSFEFTNTGRAPLILQRVISSCDCAVAEWPKEPVMPGANGVVKVKFNPLGRVGKFEKLITIYSNAETPTVVLFVKGVVLERPKTIEDIYNRVIGNLRFKNIHIPFNRIYSYQTKVDTIDFIYTGLEPVKIGANYNGMPHIKVVFVPETLKANDKGLMIVTFDAKEKGDWGFVTDRFVLTQNGKDIPGSIITVSATIEENFTNLTDEQKANAAKIEVPVENFDFGEVSEGDIIEKDFEFSNVGKSDLFIRKIKPSCGCTTVEPAEKIIKPGKKSSVKVSVRTNGFTGQRIAKTVTIITNDPSNPSVTIRLTGNVLPKK